MSEDKNSLVYREQLDDNVIEMLKEDIGNNYSLRTENQRTIVSALNEIHGKDVISNAVGSPLLSTDTFDIMGDKIKGLITDFKTKLLRLNISTSSVDKLESLINKLDGIILGDPEADDRINAIIESLRNILIENNIDISDNEDWAELIVKIEEMITELKIENSINSSNNLNIICATELPANGVDNQVCVITDNPVNNFVLTNNIEDINTNNLDTIYIPLNAIDTTSKVVTTGSNIKTNYHINRIMQGDMRLASYVYRNNIWEELTISKVYFIEDNVLKNNDIFGGIPNGSTWSMTSNGLATSNSGMFKFITSKNTIDFSKYTQMKIMVSHTSTSSNATLYVGLGLQSLGEMNYNVSSSTEIRSYCSDYKMVQVPGTANATIHEYLWDISNWTATTRLLLLTGYSGSFTFRIHEILFY